MRKNFLIFLFSSLMPLSAPALLCQEILETKPTLESIKTKFEVLRSINMTDYGANFHRVEIILTNLIKELHSLESFEYFMAKMETANSVASDQLPSQGPIMYKSIIVAKEQSTLPELKNLVDMIVRIHQTEPIGELPLTGLYAQELLNAAMRITESHPLKTDILQLLLPLMEIVENIGRSTKTW